MCFDLLSNCPQSINLNYYKNQIKCLNSIVKHFFMNILHWENFNVSVRFIKSVKDFIDIYPCDMSEPATDD